jgi:hypothetical protein
MQDKKRAASILKNPETLEGHSSHGDMSNEPRQLNATCRNCNVPSEHPIFCDGCVDDFIAGSQERQVTARAERDARVAAYAGQPMMNSFEWIEYLRIFEFDALASEAHMNAALLMFNRFGQFMPFEASLNDHDDLSNALTMADLACEALLN